MDNYDSNFDWRWRLESIQPGGPTGANIGNLLQDLRTVWHGGQANAVNNELAQNAAYRKELDNEGKELQDVWNSIDKRNLELAKFADSQVGREMQRIGHMNAAVANLNNAKDPIQMEYAIKTARAAGMNDEQIEEVIANKRKNDEETLRKQKNWDKLMASDVFKEKYIKQSEKDAAINAILDAIDNGEIDESTGYKEISRIRQGRSIGSELTEAEIKTRNANKTARDLKKKNEAEDQAEAASAIGKKVKR